MPDSDVDGEELIPHNGAPFGPENRRLHPRWKEPALGFKWHTYAACGANRLALEHTDHLLLCLRWPFI